MRPKTKVYEDFETDVNYQYLLFLLLLLLFWPQILLVKRESDIYFFAILPLTVLLSLVVFIPCHCRQSINNNVRYFP